MTPLKLAFIASRRHVPVGPNSKGTRADRDHRRGLSRPRRRRRRGQLLASAHGRGRRDWAIAGRALERRRPVPPRPRPRRHDRRTRRRLLTPRRHLRCGVLRHHPPRSAGYGSSAALAARGVLGGARARGPTPGPPQPHADGRVRRRLQQPTTRRSNTRPATGPCSTPISRRYRAQRRLGRLSYLLGLQGPSLTSTPPAPRRSSPFTSPAKGCAAAIAAWRWRAG